MTTNYRRGANFERRVLARLEDDGYWCMRSSGSHTAVDVIAIKPGQVVMVQAKWGGRLPADEWNELYYLATKTGSVPVAAVKLTPRKWAFMRLVGTKTPGVLGQPQPWQLWTTDEIE